jgi:hypothetical protein
MGLDMYLRKKTYVGNQYRDPERRVMVVVPENQDGVTFPAGAIKTERVSEIVEMVGSWRKANQIHNWFVRNVQEHEDDCKEYYVDVEQLQELVTLCQKVINTAILVGGKIHTSTVYSGGKMVEQYEEGMVIANAEEVAELLPNSEGFFFGSQDYNEYYLQQLRNTVEMLTPLIEEGGDYYYQSSW